MMAPHSFGLQGQESWDETYPLEEGIYDKSEEDIEV